ncbi:MAG: class I SAM-dependent methyltransferase [Clostridiales bacterium]|jgi:23S rRNA (cytosine1962-C5)-methyltransferase|nr:class I SAM-dependent methyltransferase [Clostridiales bacterium]
MLINNEWTDYEIIATGNGEKLERWSKYHLIRPDPQIIWKPLSPLRKIADISAVYEKNDGSSDASWKFYTTVPDDFTVGWRSLRFKLRLTNFKHTGLFPEQAANWARMIDLITSARAANPERTVNVLNLFAYTGGATLACLSAGASVTHLDGARAMVERASENAYLSGLGAAPCRYIIDDCMKFVVREIKRGKKYDAIIMDPPSFGRGPNGEVWKLETNLFDLVCATASILGDDPLFYLINSYTTGLQPSVMTNIIARGLRRKGEFIADEIGLPTREKGIILPAGASAWLTFTK